MHLKVKVFQIQTRCPWFTCQIKLARQFRSHAIEVTEQNQSPVEVTKSPSEANNSRQSPVEAKTILNKSPITVTNTDLPIVVEPVEAPINANNNPLWSVEYKEYYHWRVNCDEYENESPYRTLRSALMNAFNDNNFAFIILEGYIIALINTVDCITVSSSYCQNIQQNGQKASPINHWRWHNWRSSWCRTHQDKTKLWYKRHWHYHWLGESHHQRYNVDLIKKLDSIASKIQLQLILLFFVIHYFYTVTVVF